MPKEKTKRQVAARVMQRSLVAKTHARLSSLRKSQTCVDNDQVLATLTDLTDGFVIFDREWHYIYVNAAAARLLNKKPNQLLGRILWDVYPDAKELPACEDFHRALEQGVPVQFEMYYPGMGWFENRCQPVGDCLAVYFSNVTERKNTEEELRRQGERLELACTAANIGIWDWNLETRKLKWSKEHFKISGVDEKEFVPTVESIEALIHPEDRAAIWRAINESTSRGNLFEHEHRVIRPDGSVRWLVSIGRAFYSDDGTPVRMMGALRDITTRKQAEQELRRVTGELAKANAVLEQNVRDRTAKLQETITELERFSYALTHDIRAPLRAMSGYSDLLLQDCGAQLEEAHRDLLRRIATAAVRMDSLVTDALQYHRAINSEFELKPVDVTKLLRDMVEAYPQFQSPRAKVTVAEDIPTILGNEGSLIQCFSNLLNNAVKFVRPDAVPEINVWAERTGDRVRLWFQDNGIGIAPEYHERVWTLFERLNTSYEGTGLGLAVVRKLVERMRGNTGVESTAGEGSRFWIELSAA